MSKLKRLLCYESQHQSPSNEKSLVQFDYEKAVSNYLGTQSTFNPRLRCGCANATLKRTDQPERIRGREKERESEREREKEGKRGRERERERG